MNNSFNYCIKQTNILLVEVKKFSHIEGIVIVEEELSKKEMYRKVLFYDHMFIDFETGDILEELFDKNGNVKESICVNTRYITRTYQFPYSTDQDLIKATKLYEDIVRKKRLIQEKKLINFPQKRIY